MKASSFRILTLVVLLPMLALAQQSPAPNQQPSPCNTLPYKVFQGNADKKPVVLNKLGTSPQFGEIPKHTSKSAYDHLKRVYRKNQRGIKKEMDDLLVALGYSGVNDPAFTEGSITAETLPKGSTGWMGAYAKGHKYVWSILGRPFETFRIKAKTGDCFIYIMKKCGNAFYIPTYVTAPLPYVPPTTCVDQQVSITASGEISSGDVLNASKTMEVVAVNGEKGLCLGSIPVTYRGTYDFSVKGDMSYSKVIPVCVEGNASPSPINLTLPLNLDYKITKSEITVGDGEKIYLTVDEKQFKALSKAYKSCPVSASTTASTQTFEKKVLSESPTDVTIGTAGAAKCADQKINFMGKTEIQDASIKSASPSVTLIGVYKKTGKLAKGEMPEKYLCLGSFPVPVKSSYEVVTSGLSNVSKIFRVCDANGNPLPDQNVNIPVNLNYNFTKQEVMVGDYNKLYISIDEDQYKKLSKSYNRCCKDGKEGSCVEK
ncbi:hypothetical protein [Emticicia soli]|uniref:Uncharacterized protein n=1 Tax=Emticicia soli TaxID=2027878 RepID=A0ABW5J827_9BACT